MVEVHEEKCQACGRKMAKQGSVSSGTAKAGYECSRCHERVCGDCTDWNVSEKNQWVCSRCAGRTAPQKCGCD